MRHSEYDGRGRLLYEWDDFEPEPEETGEQIVDRLLHELGVLDEVEANMDKDYGLGGTYVLGEKKPKRSKQDGGLERYKERKWPITSLGH